MATFTDEMREAIVAANDLLRRELERDLAAGHSVHFMAEGRFYEWTRDGVFELTQIGDDLVRSSDGPVALARAIELVTPKPDPFTSQRPR
jgi:hypothetical protein